MIILLVVIMLISFIYIIWMLYIMMQYILIFFVHKYLFVLLKYDIKHFFWDRVIILICQMVKNKIIMCVQLSRWNDHYNDDHYIILKTGRYNISSMQKYQESNAQTRRNICLYNIVYIHKRIRTVRTHTEFQ